MTGAKRPRILDITRLAGRVGRAPLTGVDRVECAYLRAITQAPEAAYLVVRTALGWIVLPGTSAPKILNWIEHPARIPPAGLAARLLWRRGRPRRLEAALRTIALRRLSPGGFWRWLRTTCPTGADWFSVGHVNLSDKLLRRVHALKGFRLVVMIHDTIPLDHPDWSGKGGSPRFAKALQASLAHANLILCPSAQTAADVQRWAAGRPLPDILVAHLGISRRPPKKAAGPSARQPYFVVLGTIEPRKGIGFVLDLWARLQDRLAAPDMPHLMLVGRRGWIGPDLAARLDRGPMMGRSILERPDLGDDEVTALLTGAHGLLAPSRTEGFGLPAAEAASLGLPVLATDLAVTREILGAYPRYLPANDLQAWASAVLAMSALPHRQTKMTPPPLPDWTDHFNRVFNHLR